jgi:hypothetical protein
MVVVVVGMREVDWWEVVVVGGKAGGLVGGHGCWG